MISLEDSQVFANDLQRCFLENREKLNNVSEDNLTENDSFQKCLIITQVLQNEDLWDQALLLWLSLDRSIDKLLGQFAISSTTDPSTGKTDWNVSIRASDVQDSN